MSIFKTHYDGLLVLAFIFKGTSKCLSPERNKPWRSKRKGDGTFNRTRLHELDEKNNKLNNQLSERKIQRQLYPKTFLIMKTRLWKWIYVRKSWEKSFWKKHLEIKTLEKKSEFSHVLGNNVTGNTVLCFGFLWLFSLK